MPPQAYDLRISCGLQKCVEIRSYGPVGESVYPADLKSVPQMRVRVRVTSGLRTVVVIVAYF